MLTDDRSETRKAGVRFVLWVALGAGLIVTAASSVVMATAARFRGLTDTIGSLGMSSEDARHAAAHVVHDFRVEMGLTAAFAALLLIGWLLVTRYLRSHRPPLSRESKRGRLGVGVLVGVLGYGFLALPLHFLAHRIAPRVAAPSDRSAR
jgi:hypothetical protein